MQPVETIDLQSPEAPEYPENRVRHTPAAEGPSQNDIVNGLFLERVQQIPGVVHVRMFGGEHLGEKAFEVFVEDGNLDAEYAVYDLKAELIRQFDRAWLVVYVLEESDIPRA